MNDFSFTNTADPEVYYNQNYRNFFLNHRSVYASLATSLVQEGQDEKAVEVVDYIMKTISPEAVPMDITGLDFAQVYFATGNDEKGLALVEGMWKDNYELFNYLIDHELPYMSRERQISIAVLSQIVQILRQYDLNEKALEYQDEIRVLYEKM